MIKTKAGFSKLRAFSALALLIPIACSDTMALPDDSVGVTSQAVKDKDERPSLEDFLKNREEKRKPKPAPLPKTEKAAQKLAEFEQRVAEKQKEWEKLPPEERELKRAKLKHELLIGTPSAEGI